MEEELKKLVAITSWFISLQIITLLAFLGGAALLYTDMQNLKQSVAAGTNTGARPPIPEDVDNWADYIHGHEATSGDATAEIVIVEFTDFQCPYCKAFNETTRNQITSKYGDQVRVVFKHFPLERIHTEAKQAAVAAQCALREGKFWEIKDIFFNNPSELSTEFLLEAGKTLGLGEQYSDCVTNQETLAEVEQDIQDGLQAGVQGTPTFLINGKVAMGAISLAAVDLMIEQLD